MSRRIGLSTLSAFMALVVSVVVFARTPGAIATQGEAVIAGMTNTSTVETVLHNTEGQATCSGGPFAESGLAACGFQGVYGEGVIGIYGAGEGNGAVQGVFGFTDQAAGYGIRGRNAGGGVGILGFSNGGPGVKGEAGFGGAGILGTHTGNEGVGVQGETAGVGAGVYGLATANGVGVFGDTTNGVGIQARSTNGPALNVLGKARFSRSGIITVAAGRTSRTVNMAGVTTSSMVLATAQQIASVYVKAVVPATNMFVIRLTNVAPAGGLKVAYFVLN